MPANLNRRILILTERFYPEDFLINDFAKSLVKAGYDVAVLTQAPSYPYGKIHPGYKNWPFQTEHWEGIKIHRFFTVPGYNKSLILKLLNYFNFAFTGTLAALFLARKRTRVFIYQTGPLTLALPAVAVKNIFGSDITIWTQDVWPDSVYAYGFKKTLPLRLFLDWLVKTVYSNCDKILVSCEGFKPKISAYAPQKKISCFPNWALVDCKPPDGPALKLSDTINFTFAGNIGKVQNLENVLRGFALFKNQGGAGQLNIIGEGSNLAAIKEICGTGHIPSVVFWGRKKPDEMPAYYAASDVLLISLSDSPIFELTVPSKFQTYLTAGKPVLCAMKGEVRRLVETNNLGFCADPADISAIAQAFLHFAKLPAAELAAYGTRARALYESAFSRERIIAGITAAINA